MLGLIVTASLLGLQTPGLHEEPMCSAFVTRKAEAAETRLTKGEPPQELDAMAVAISGYCRVLVGDDDGAARDFASLTRFEGEEGKTARFYVHSLWNHVHVGRLMVDYHERTGADWSFYGFEESARAGAAHDDSFMKALEPSWRVESEFRYGMPGVVTVSPRSGGSAATFGRPWTSEP